MDNNETILMNTQFVDEFINEITSKKDIVCAELEEHISIFEQLEGIGAIAGEAATQLIDMSNRMRELENNVVSYLNTVTQKIDEIKTQRISSDQKASQTFQDIASQTDAYKGSGA